MKLVKLISENTYHLIEDGDYNSSIHLDRSDNIAYWYNFYTKVGLSYWQMRYQVRQVLNAQAGGFNDFRNPDKDILGLLGLGDQTDTITYYVTVKGLSVADASGLHILRLSENTARLSLDARGIVASPKTMQIGIKYLTWIDGTTGQVDSTQANNLTHAIQGFLTELERYAVLGLEYGDEREGLMDYFESTNSYSSGGLKNYVFSPSMVTAYGSEDNTRLAMIEELKEVFVKGNI